MSATPSPAISAGTPSPTVRRRGGRVMRRIDGWGYSGLRILRSARTILAFAFVTFASIGRQRTAHPVLRSLIGIQLYRSGWRLLPMTGFVALGLGWIVIGQTIALLSRLGAQAYLGPVMVTATVRELGPLLVAFLVLARAGTAQVVELGTARAQGEIEALEALGIDPIHYLVLPRVAGLALATYALTIYFDAIALLAGYLFAFVQNTPVPLSTYVGDLLGAMTGLDFVWMALKSCGYGVLIGAVTCYQGLARPLRLEDVGPITTRALVQSIVGCIVINFMFLAVYFVK
jgi:phospholipid/cholesterol/gamma-HCH transport system permease protein